MATGYQHPLCYARALCDCSEETSREHPVTDKALRHIGGPTAGNPSVRSRNLDHQKPGVREALVIGKFASEILCRKHNSALSSYDTAGIEICKATEKLALATANPAENIIPINGDDFERWMLKTLCSSLCSGKVWRELRAFKGLEPPLDWLEMLYSGANIQTGQGIYLQPYRNQGLTENDRDDVEFHPLFSEDKWVIGLRGWFFGFRFDLVIRGLTPGAPTSYRPEVYRPSELGVVGSGTRIRFHYAGRKELMI